MIESKSRIIFVLVPGIREYIKQHGREEDTQRMIKRATLVRIGYDPNFILNCSTFLCMSNSTCMTYKLLCKLSACLYFAKYSFPIKFCLARCCCEAF